MKEAIVLSCDKKTIKQRGLLYSPDYFTQAFAVFVCVCACKCNNNHNNNDKHFTSD